jgi:hypothetical protein
MLFTNEISSYFLWGGGDGFVIKDLWKKVKKEEKG